jgi:hypothetical protein
MNLGSNLRIGMRVRINDSMGQAKEQAQGEDCLSSGGTVS